MEEKEKMKLWVKGALFISAYTPLLLILILKYLNPSDFIFFICIFLLILVNLIWIIIFKITRSWTSSTYTVKKSINRSSDALDYIIAYVITFLGFEFKTWQDITSIFILLIVIFFVYVHSNLIFTNPLLNIFGFKIQQVEVQEGGEMVLITKKFNLKKGDKITVKNMSDNIFLEVKKNVKQN